MTNDEMMMAILQMCCNQGIENRANQVAFLPEDQKKELHNMLKAIDDFRNAQSKIKPQYQEVVKSALMQKIMAELSIGEMSNDHH